MTPENIYVKYTDPGTGEVVDMGRFREGEHIGTYNFLWSPTGIANPTIVSREEAERLDAELKQKKSR
ncbi:hypothetical protein HY494_02265 [Candidatus Woesearchaeota archaeon]|nr:hypothetical protein [Candidatus Woesearchaeota archaeon]